MKILYLEDNAADADLTKRKLQHFDPKFDLDIVGTLADAFARIETFESIQAEKGAPLYQLVLLDMHLPDGSGLSLLAHIRDRMLPIAVVVLTGSGDEETVLAAIRAGADDYLIKKMDYWAQLPNALQNAYQNFQNRTDREKRPIRLLYVEHNQNDIDLLRLHLAKHAPFIRMEAVESAARALVRLPLHGPVTDVDVILLDFRLVGIDALELLKEFIQVRKLDVPILINSGQGTEEVALKALNLGAMDYMVKSHTNLQRLPFIVESAFYRSQAQRERNALKKSEARLRTIIETEPECVKLVGMRGELLEMNAAGLSMLEAASFAEVCRVNLIEYILPEYRIPFRELHQRVMGGGSGLLEFEILGLKGTRRWLETHAAPMRGATGKVEALLGITRDITQRKRTEEQLRQTEKMSAIGQLAGGIAHDFNNQLAIILGYSELLGYHLENPELKRFNDAIILAAKRSGDLTRGLLAFSRQGKYQKVSIDLHTLIRETAEMLNRSIDKRIIVNLHLNAVPSTLIGDAAQIQNALLNLALNAKDAMPKGGILAFTTEVVELVSSNDQATTSVEGEGQHGLASGRYLYLKVTDTGTGMSNEVKKRIFEPFFTTKPIGKGSGMGLASVFGTVGLHQGAIFVKSEVGQGTAFHIHLPLSQVLADRLKSQMEPAMTQKLRVLVVDDEEYLRAIFADLLEKEGHKVIKAEGGRQALLLYKADWQKIDLVILDMVMPDMDGLSTLQEFQTINPTAKVILTSGYSPNSELESVLANGAQGFLSKPFERAQLNAVIARVFDQADKGGMGKRL